MITKMDRVVVTQEQVATDLGDGLAILHLESGVYYSLNKIGARIWQLIQEPQLVHEIVDIIVEEYDVSVEECERDVLRLLQKLASEELIRLDGESDS